MSAQETILVIENEPDSSRQRVLLHTLAPYCLVFAKCGEQAGQMLARHQPALVLLSLSGAQWDADLEINILQARRCGPAPITVLAPVCSACYVVSALNAGADDYVCWPIDGDELSARCRAQLRRLALDEASSPSSLTASVPLRSADGYLELHADQRQVFTGARGIRLTKTEFELLQQMMCYAGKVLTHRWLLEKVWGPQYDEQSNYLRVYIRQLRSKVEPDPARPRYIHTLAGVGYIFQ